MVLFILPFPEAFCHIPSPLCVFHLVYPPGGPTNHRSWVCSSLVLPQTSETLCIPPHIPPDTRSSALWPTSLAWAVCIDPIPAFHPRDYSHLPTPSILAALCVQHHFCQGLLTSFPFLTYPKKLLVLAFIYHTHQFRLCKC